MMQTQDKASSASHPTASYAVVFKTYAWDDFILRQAQRCAAVTGRGDFYVSVDETNGSVGPIPFDHVIRTNCTDMIGLGLANRFERGSLLWWNADFAHYQFFDLHPEYDFYVFIEYDALAHLDLDRMVDQIAERGIDFVCLPIREEKEEWAWTAPHQKVYPLEEIEGTLICISVFSKRAVQLLFNRRLEMSVAPGPPYWPISEVFMPTEIKRAGLRTASLDNFGSLTHYDWFPPIHEDDAMKLPTPAFLHPVYDSGRFIRRAKAGKPDIWALIDRNNRIASTLVRRHPLTYLSMTIKALVLGISSTVARALGISKGVSPSAADSGRP
jgi:hypothetical protein